MSYIKMALKFGPWLMAAVLAGLLAASSGRVSDLSDKLAVQAVKLKTAKADLDAANGRIADFSSAVAERDTLLAKQSASIRAVAERSQRDRVAYDAALKTARGEAASGRAAADALLALQAPDGELAQCRAARDLLEAELVPK